MSEYNGYAQRLDTAFKAFRSDFQTAYKALQQARENASKPGQDALKKQIAAFELEEATRNMRTETIRLWDRFRTERRTIRAELENAVKAAGLANPDEIDGNALELMKSGVLNSADYVALAERFDQNRTMLKLIAKHSHEAAEAARAAGNNSERSTLNSVYIACKDGDSAALRAFDSLSKVSDYCRGERYEGDRSRPEHIAAMSDKWEHLTAAAIEDF